MDKDLTSGQTQMAMCSKSADRQRACILLRLLGFTSTTRDGEDDAFISAGGYHSYGINTGTAKVAILRRGKGRLILQLSSTLPRKDLVYFTNGSLTQNHLRATQIMEFRKRFI